MVFFRHFRDGDATYLARSWLKDPVVAEERTRSPRSKWTAAAWNGRDYYVMFGHEEARDWEDARQYGYVSAGGGSAGASHFSDFSRDTESLFIFPNMATSLLER